MCRETGIPISRIGRVRWQWRRAALLRCGTCPHRVLRVEFGLTPPSETQSAIERDANVHRSFFRNVATLCI